MIRKLVSVCMAMLLGSLLLPLPSVGAVSSMTYDVPSTSTTPTTNNPEYTAPIKAMPFSESDLQSMASGQVQEFFGLNGSFVAILGGNPFQGKTPQQIDKMFRDKGFDVKGTDPMAGKGSYINPKTGRKYYIDKGGKYKKGTELPHVDVHRPSSSSLPKRKLPLGDRLIE